MNERTHALNTDPGGSARAPVVRAPAARRRRHPAESARGCMHVPSTQTVPREPQRGRDTGKPPVSEAASRGALRRGTPVAASAASVRTRTGGGCGRVGGRVGCCPIHHRACGAGARLAVASRLRRRRPAGLVVGARSPCLECARTCGRPARREPRRPGHRPPPHVSSVRPCVTAGCAQ
jgi:hypothetical protein